MKTFKQFRIELEEANNPKSLNRNDAVKLLKVNGFVLDRNGADHDIYKSQDKKMFALPRHKTLSPGITKQIYKLIGV